ncbi:hypothetical protein B0H11DRAFT_2245110 [Mycena galericulata]|nr:hypothetical protein B0H11DRAFT_2245110 [Mycena galericulata]
MAPPSLSIEERQNRRRKQSRRYNDRNYEERNAKKRVRMATLRALDRVRSPEELAERVAARRASDKKYRESHRKLLAVKARWDRQQRAAGKATVRVAQQADRDLRRRRSQALIACRIAIEKIRVAVDAEITLAQSSDTITH